MINFAFHNMCTGCKACADVCPKRCITFYEDKDGFVIPKVDKVDCIDCHKCEKVCPELNHIVDNYDNHKCYAAYNNDSKIRHDGSSGSVFYALASNVISKSGAVYGAEMCEDLQVRHTSAIDIEGVRKQMKSKYIQSDTTGVYRKVIEDLKQGKDVLFVGTPCQCKALHNLTPLQLRSNLLIVDFVCHGVPSQSLFNKSIKQYEKNHNCKVNNFSFREKSDKELRNIRIDYSNYDGKSQYSIEDPDLFPYCYGFFYHYTQRNSCYNCKMRSIERDSDLTLADFWGIDKLLPEANDIQKGYSMIVTNSDKGAKALEELRNCNIREIKNGVEFCVNRNHAYTKPDGKSIMRGLFFWTMRSFCYETAEKHFLMLQPSTFDRLWHAVAYRLDRTRK